MRNTSPRERPSHLLNQLAMLSLFFLTVLGSSHLLHAQHASPGVSARFDKSWVDYDVIEDGAKGMQIHVKFTVNNLKGADSYVAIYFETKDGTRLKDKNQKLYSTSGEVAIYRSLKPGYDSTVYEDLQLFMPYSELELSPGKYNLRMDIDLIKNEGGLIQHLAFHEFEYEKSGEANQTPATQKPSAKLDRIWIDYDVVEDGRKGMRVHAKFTVNNLKGVDSYLAAYFEKRDGTALKTTNTTYASKTGQVAVYRSMKPGYEPTDYSDLSVFMPYDELNLSSGSYDLRVDLDVIYKAGELIQHLDYYNFTYRSGS